MAKAKAYSYIRFSTPDQIQGDSLRRQTERSIHYAREHDLDLDDKLTFKDLGKSGFRGKNIEEGELGAFLSAVTTGKIKRGSYLLVENFDRLSRLPARATLRQLEDIVAAGVNVITLQDGKEYTQNSLDENFYDLLMALMSMNLGHEESQKKSIRIQASYTARRKRAAESPGTPIAGNRPAWIVRDSTGHYQLDTGRAAVVRKIFELAAGGLGHHGIAKYLNETRVPLITGSRTNATSWWPGYVIKILRSPAVTGRFQPHQMVGGKRVPVGETLDGYFPRVIEDSLFDRVQDMRASKRVPSGPKGTSKNLFTGIAKCARCNSPMHRIDKGPRWQYLICSNALRGNGCKYETWNLDDFENVVLTTLCKDMDWSGLSPRVKETTASTIEQLEERQAELRLNIAQCGQQVDRAVDLLMSNEASPSLMKQHSDLEAKRVELAAEEKTVTEQLRVEREKLLDADRTAQSTLQAFASWMTTKRNDPEARQRLSVVLRDNIEEIQLDSAGESRTIEVVFKTSTRIHLQDRMVLPFDLQVSLGAAIQRRHGIPLLPIPPKHRRKRK